MTIIEAFDMIQDPRRAEGKRTSLGQIFSMVVISNLCGYLGYRPVSNFCKSQKEVFTEALGLKHEIPSHVTFRDVLQRTDQAALISCFNTWCATYVALNEGDWVSGDGKALSSTVTHAHDSAQDFQSVVSFFCQESGLVRLIETYRNAKKGEREVVIGLLGHLQGMGLIIRLDALHTQKKRLTAS